MVSKAQGPGEHQDTFAWCSSVLPSWWRQPGTQLLRAVLKDLNFVLEQQCLSQS